jgi:Ras-related protein Rab-5C
VGKTCISLRYCRGWTNLNELPTVGASFYAKNLEINGIPIKFEIWDTAGQERYASLAPMYYRGADGALLVYDITNSDSFEAMKKWDSEISASVPECAKLIIGSKVDLVGSRQVPSDVVQAYSEERNIPHCLTSSKTGEGIEEAFNQMAAMVMSNQQNSGNTLSR